MMTDLYRTPGTVDAVVESLSTNPQAAAILAAEIAYNRFELNRPGDLFCNNLEIDQEPIAFS